MLNCHIPRSPPVDLSDRKGLIIIDVRDLSYEEAMSEIGAYIKSVGGRRVYISEVALKLQIDMELIEEILEDIQ